MGVSNLTTNLSIGTLTPAPSVPSINGQSSNRDGQDNQGNPQRSHTQVQAGTEKEEPTEQKTDDQPGPDGSPEHQLDQLA
jgi:hypothetical protein